MLDNNISNNPNSNIVVGGNQTINNIVEKISIDIGRLSSICETNAKEIIELLNKLESDCQAIEYGDDFIKIDTKNKINELEIFYTELIKEEEAKLAISSVLDMKKVDEKTVMVLSEEYKLMGNF